MRGHRLGVMAVGAALALAAAACGSTATLHGALSTSGGGSGLADGGLSATSPGTSTGTVPPSSGPAGTAGPIDTTPAGSSSVAASNGSTLPPSAGGTTPSTIGTASGPATLSPISIGIQYVDDPPAVAAILGAGGTVPTNADYVDTAQITADYIDAHGGLAGHKIIIVPRADPLTAGDYATVDEATCDFFTQDHPVFAVIGIYSESYNLARCLAGRHTPFIYGLYAAFPPSVLSQLEPYYYNLTAPDVSKIGLWIDALAAMGYFTGWNTSTGTPDPSAPVKVGMLTFDSSWLQSVLSTYIEPRLAAHGIKLADIYTMSTPQGFGDVASAATQTQSGVLRLKSEGITHLLFWDTSAEELLFGPDAQSQHYFPRWGLTSIEELQGILVPDDSHTVLQGSMGLGWSPLNDMAPAQDPGLNPQEKLCQSLMAKAGVNPARQFTPMQECDGLFFLQAGLDAATSLTPQGMFAAVEHLGTGFRDALTLTGLSNYTPEDPTSGTYQYRDFAYQNSCFCYTYTGSLFTG